MTNEEWRLDHYGRVRELEGVVGLICAIYAWRALAYRAVIYTAGQMISRQELAFQQLEAILADAREGTAAHAAYLALRARKFH